MEAKLIVANGKHAGQKITVRGPKFFIGRAEDCQLRPRSDLVSRHHCVIMVEEDHVAVRDFGSKNGTLVNGHRIAAEQELKTGDRLQIGLLVFEVELPATPGSQKERETDTVQQAASQTVASAREEDVDLADWFATDDQSAADAETKTLDAAGATQMLGAKADGKATEEPSEEEPKKEPDKEQPPVKVVGVSKARQKAPRAPSSRDAAAEMLKKFYNRG